MGEDIGNGFEGVQVRTIELDGYEGHDHAGASKANEDVLTKLDWNYSEREQSNGQDDGLVQDHEKPRDRILQISSSIEKQMHVDGPVACAPKWNVFRMLVPTELVDNLIGHEEEYLKNECVGAGVLIKFFNGPPETVLRAVMVLAEGKRNSVRPPIVDGLLKVHKCLVAALRNDASESLPDPQGKVSARLLVLAMQAKRFIDSNNIKLIAEKCNCVIRVLRAETPPIYFHMEDMIIEVQAKHEGVCEAIDCIASFLANLSLYDKDMIHFVEKLMGRPPPIKTHPGISAYGIDSVVVDSSSTLPIVSFSHPKSMHRLRIPLCYADAIIGQKGANITLIRQFSRATIALREINEAQEMKVEICGRISQVLIAEDLVLETLEKVGGYQLAEKVKRPYLYGSWRYCPNAS